MSSLSPPNVNITYHQLHFDMAERDDVWLHSVGAWGWIVISQDYSFHLKDAELAAIRQHGIGCFYLWGSEAGKWESMRVFMRAYDKIITESGRALRPFVFEVTRHGGLREIVI